MNAVDPWGLEATPDNWWNPYYWGKSDWAAFRTGLGEGAMAYIDGFIPFVDPFASNNMYDSCNSEIKDAYDLGEIIRDIDLSLLFAAGKEITIGKNLRIAPFGNRTKNILGQLPHIHQRVVNPATGETLPGQGIKWHRPWEKPLWLKGPKQ